MPGGQAWSKQQANQFLIRDAQPNDVLKLLQTAVDNAIQLIQRKPNDLDSTEPIDSFIESLYVVIES